MGSGRVTRSVAGFAVVTALAAGVTGIIGTGPAQATVTCPGVVIPSGSLIGTVTPAPTAGVDWSGCDLSHADFGGMTLTDVDFSGAGLANAELAGAHVSGSDFAGTDLENDEFDWLSGTSLAGADVSGVYFNTVNALVQIKSGGLTDPDGAPHLPFGWLLKDGYLLGPGDDFSGLDFSALAGQ